MEVLHIERLLYYRRHSLYSLELHGVFDWRATAPDMHQLFSDATLCAYTTTDVEWSSSLSLP